MQALFEVFFAAPPSLSPSAVGGCSWGKTGQGSSCFNSLSALSSRVLFFLAFSPLVTKRDQSLRVGVVLYQREFASTHEPDIFALFLAQRFYKSSRRFIYKRQPIPLSRLLHA